MTVSLVQLHHYNRQRRLGWMNDDSNGGSKCSWYYRGKGITTNWHFGVSSLIKLSLLFLFYLTFCDQPKRWNDNDHIQLLHHFCFSRLFIVYGIFITFIVYSHYVVFVRSVVTVGSSKAEARFEFLVNPPPFRSWVVISYRNSVCSQVFLTTFYVSLT